MVVLSKRVCENESMIDIVVSFFAELVENFQELGALAYWLILLIAFFDSLIVTGTFINGTAFLLLAGVMIARGTHDFAEMAIFASVGAVSGGVVGYYLGRMGSRFMQRKNQNRYTKHFSVGKKLFKEYGGFSVFIGRFFGPVSSIVAFVAGTLGVSRTSFIFWNTLAGICWGVGYVTIGNFLGDSLTILRVL